MANIFRIKIFHYFRFLKEGEKLNFSPKGSMKVKILNEIFRTLYFRKIKPFQPIFFVQILLEIKVNPLLVPGSQIFIQICLFIVI